VRELGVYLHALRERELGGSDAAEFSFRLR
jgi:hypothetical protein